MLRFCSWLMTGAAPLLRPSRLLEAPRLARSLRPGHGVQRRETTKKFCRQRRSCGLFFCSNGMAVNQVFCRQDKLPMDANYRVATVQKKLE